MKPKSFFYLLLLSHLSGALIVITLMRLTPITIILNLREEIYLKKSIYSDERAPETIILIDQTNPPLSVLDAEDADFAKFLRQNLETKIEKVPMYFMQDMLTYQNSQVPMCEEFDSQDLAIVVLSVCSSTGRREAIRISWGIEAGFLGIPVVFFVGTDKDGECVSANREQTEFNDVVIGNFVDSEFNQTLKTVLALKWTDQFCSKSFLLTVNDSDIVNVNGLWEHIFKYKLDLQGKIAGSRIQTRHTIEANQVSSTSDENSLYIPNLRLLMSQTVIKDMYFTSLLTPYSPACAEFVMDTVAGKLGITLTNDKRFDLNDTSLDACTFRRSFIVQNVDDVKTFIEIWEEIHSPSDCDDNSKI